MATKSISTSKDEQFLSRICGFIRLTSLKTNPVDLKKGILSIYSHKGRHHCTICQNAEGKLRSVQRRFNLEKNIRQIHHRGENLTIVLINNDLQIILKECDPDVAETICRLLAKIKNGIFQSFPSSSILKESSISLSPKTLNKEYLSVSDISKTKKRHLPQPFRNVSTVIKKVVHGIEDSAIAGKIHPSPFKKTNFYGKSLEEATPPKFPKTCFTVKRKSVFGEHLTQSLPSNHCLKYAKEFKERSLDYDIKDVTFSPVRDKMERCGSPVPLRTRLFPSSENQTQSTHKGFTNMGNTCYMNAVLQSLLELKQFSLELKHWKKLSSSMHKPLLSAVLVLLEAKEKSKNIDNGQFSALYKLKKVIDDSMDKFLGFEQQDAHEFLLCLLDQLKEEVTSLKKHIDDSSNLPVDLPCPVQVNFESIIANKITCVGCKKEAIKEEIYNDVAIDLPRECSEEMLNLQDLLYQGFKDESITCQCEGCDENKAVYCRRFQKVPRILVLHLKRYRCSETELFSLKNQKHVRIPKELAIAELSTSSVAISKKIAIESPSRNKENIPLLKSSQENPPLINLTTSPLQSSRLPTTPTHQRYNLTPTESLKRTVIIDRELLQEKPTFGRDSKFASLDALDSEEEGEDKKYEEDLKEAINASLDENDQLQLALQMSMEDSCLQAMPSPVKQQLVKEDDCAVNEPTRLPTISETDGTSINYELLGVVSHIGDSTSIGHYVCDMYDEDLKEWKTFNDESITKATEFEIRLSRQHCGYIFFYGLK